MFHLNVISIQVVYFIVHISCLCDKRKYNANHSWQVKISNSIWTKSSRIQRVIRHNFKTGKRVMCKADLKLHVQYDDSLNYMTMTIFTTWQYLLQQLIISISNFEIKKYIFLGLILGKKPVLSVGFKSAGDIKNKVIKVHVTGVQIRKSCKLSVPQLSWFLDCADFFTCPNFVMNIYQSWSRSVAIFFLKL